MKVGYLVRPKNPFYGTALGLITKVDTKVYSDGDAREEYLVKWLNAGGPHGPRGISQFPRGMLEVAK